MKKLFFFKSSSGNGTDNKQVHRKNPSENSDVALSRSFSSGAFHVDGISQNRQRSHLSRCFTPERQLKEAESRHMYTSRSLSTCSSNVSSRVLDRYIDGEEYLERSNKQKSRRRPPPRVQSPLLLSDSVKDKRNCNDSRDASPRSLARSVIERLSQTHGKLAKATSYDSSSDVFANVVPLTEHCDLANEYCVDYHTEQQEFYLDGKNKHVGAHYTCKELDANSELERKYEEAEKRVKLLSEEMEKQKLFSDRDFDVSSLVGGIRQMEEERLGLAYEVLSLLRSQIVEREEISQSKTDLDLHIKKMEKEKNELQLELEKELDRRSSEWSSKFEKFHMEEKRLRERVRELAEQNVSLQREVSTFHEKETEQIDTVRHLDAKVMELSAEAEEMREENLYLAQNLSKSQESYTGTTEDLDCLRKNFEEKDIECRELHKSVTRLLRTCNEQEKTIQGLRDSLSGEIKKQPFEEDEHMVKKLQIEQKRLSGVEFSLTKEVESLKLEADSLRRENTYLLNRVKGHGEEAGTMTIKLDNEMKMQINLLQDQGVSMLNESTQLCYKFVKFIKEKLAQFPESYRDTQSMNNGLSEQFLIESEMSVHGIRRGTERLKRSLETVNCLLLEKSNETASDSKSFCSSAWRTGEPNNQSVEKFLRAELRAETLITRLLKEKMYSMEQEIEQLQAEVAAGVRGNEVLQCEVRNTLDNLSISTHQLKDLKLQMVKKNDNINRLEINLQETAKDLVCMRVTLPKVLEEREETRKEVRESRERNMDLELEKEMMKKKLEKLEEDLLFKEGQITILKDTLGTKHFDIFSSPEFSHNDFLVQ